jgi:hypothetical protein
MTTLPKPVGAVISDFARFIADNKVDDVDEIAGYIEENYSDVKQFPAYNDFFFKKDGHEFFFYDNYGDEDSDELFEEAGEGVVAIALGVCIRHDNVIYCVDFNLKETSINHYPEISVFATSEKIHPDATFHAGKRAFYHYRGKGYVSMRGFHADYGREDVEARNWVSGPRTKYAIEPIESNAVQNALIHNLT